MHVKRIKLNHSFWLYYFILSGLLALIYLFDLNIHLFWTFNAIPGITGSFIWANLTILGDALVISALTLLFIRRNPQLVWTMLISAVFTTILVHTLKPLLAVERPAAVLNNELMNIIGPKHRFRAFPSGHTAAIFTFCVVLMFYTKKQWQSILLIMVAALIGISRIAVGVHWPGDVLGGAIIGFLAAGAAFYIVSWFNWSANRTAQLIIGGLLLLATLYLLFLHDTRYEQAYWLQVFIAMGVLIVGGSDYLRLIYGIDSLNYNR